MDAGECMRLSFESMRTLLRGFAHAAGGETIETDDVFAALNPAAPERSVFNSVVYGDPAALLAERPRLAAAYAERGCAWTVWAPEADGDAWRALEAAGHRLDSMPRMMGVDITAIGEPDLEGIEWEEVRDLTRANALNDVAYGYPPGTWDRGIGTGPVRSDAMRVYLAHVDGEPASTVSAYRSGSDCAIWGVATAPGARGRGLAGALTAKACADARAGGCRTTTLQASALGAPVYRRIGFEDFGAYGMWELRPPS